jgi:hypothetical protein
MNECGVYGFSGGAGGRAVEGGRGGAGTPPAPKPSRWANASREKLEAFAESYDAWGGNHQAVRAAWLALCAECPPLRTEAEVAAEALAVLREVANRGAPTAEQNARLRALAKEVTRG